MIDAIQNDLAKNIRAARERLGLSQQQLADLAGISQTTIDKIERGITKRSKYLVYIAKALSTPIHELDRTLSVDNMAAAREEAREFWESQVDTIPLFASEADFAVNGHSRELDTGLFTIGTVPLQRVPASPILPNDKVAYAIYISDSLMSPELQDGDIAVVDPRRPAITGATCVFGVANDTLRVIGHMLPQLEDQKDNWRVKVLQIDQPLLLPKALWKIVHRIVAKVYRA